MIWGAPTISNASELTVRAIGPVVGTARRSAIASRSRVAVARMGVRASTSDGCHPRLSTRSATSSTGVVVLPVPGAPSTAADAASGRSTTARWVGSRVGGADSTAAPRTNPTTLTRSTVAARADSASGVVRNSAHRERRRRAPITHYSCSRGHSHRHRQQPATGSVGVLGAEPRAVMGRCHRPVHRAASACSKPRADRWHPTHRVASRRTRRTGPLPDRSAPCRSMRCDTHRRRADATRSTGCRPGSDRPHEMAPCVRGRRPVRIVARAGVQVTFWVYARR